MKKYYVDVNGSQYEVAISENREEIVKAGQTQTVPTPTPTPQSQPAAPAAMAGTAATAGETMKAPMPGTILKVNVTIGQTVKAGDVLMILEAMKMENEIMATKAGTVAEVFVQTGALVDSEAPLCLIS